MYLVRVLVCLLLFSACQGESSSQVYTGSPINEPADSGLGTLPKLPGVQGRLTVSFDELALWRKRSHEGPYKMAGDAGKNTPGDWTRIREYADEFCRSPFDSGNSGSQDLDLWTGYDYQIDSLDQYPIWQGIKLEAAAFCYLVQNDTLAGQLAKACLLKQVRMAGGPKRVGLRIAEWPWPSSSQAKPTFESGTKECTWLLRLALTYDYILPLLKKEEKREIVAYFRSSARYFARRAQRRFEECFPNRSKGDYTERRYLADPKGVRVFGAEPIYEPDEDGNAPSAYKGRIYTHVNADGSLGNPIPRLAIIYNNRTAERMNFILLAGLLSGDKYLVDQARCYQREWLMFSVFPDGTYGEYERDGNYGNPSQGAMWYGGLCLQSYTLAADWFSRLGDKSLYTFSTRDGAHNTKVPASQPPKSFQTVLNRYVDNCRGENPIYYGEVKPENRIDIWNENEHAKYPTRYATWDYLLALANRHYRNPLYRQVYQRTASGMLPYPGKDYSTAGKVWLPWCGSSAEVPGWLFMYGEELSK